MWLQSLYATCFAHCHYDTKKLFTTVSMNGIVTLCDGEFLVHLISLSFYNRNYLFCFSRRTTVDSAVFVFSNCFYVNDQC